MIGLADPIAGYVPEECFYARFAGPQSLQCLLQAAEELSAVPEGAGGRTLVDSQLARLQALRSELARLQTQLCLPDLTGESELPDRLIAGLAIIGTPRRSARLVTLASSSRRMLPAAGCLEKSSVRSGNGPPLRRPNTALEETVTIEGREVSLIASDDGSGRVRSYYAAARDVHLITNSEWIVSGFLRARRGEGSIASTADFRIAERMMRRLRPRMPCFSSRANPARRGRSRQRWTAGRHGSAGRF